MNKLLPIVVLTALLLSASVIAPTFARSKTDKKADQTILKALQRATEGKTSNICVVQYSTKANVSDIKTAYNKTSCYPATPPPPPPVCAENEHLENGVCVPDLEPTPGSNDTITVCAVGDVSGSSLVSQMKKDCKDYVIYLGDLGYGSSLSNFKKVWVTPFTDMGTKVKCVIGNHDASEDGDSDPIVKEAKALCGEGWWVKLGGHVLLMGFNTNGNLDSQLGQAQALIATPGFLDNISTIITFSHKGGHTPPKSHHPASQDKDVVTFYQSLEAKVPDNVTLYEDTGHNHVIAESTNGVYVSGGGGKSHYECGKDSVWVMCNNTKYGFHMWVIDVPTGVVAEKFIDSSGNEITK